MIDQLSKLLEPMRRQVNGMVRRIVVTNVDDDPMRQEMQVQDGQSPDGSDVLPTVEHFQPFGVRGFPPTGIDGVGFAVGGYRNHMVAIAASTKVKPTPPLAMGDVCYYGLNPDCYTLVQNAGAWTSQGSTSWFSTLKGLSEDQYLSMTPQVTIFYVKDPNSANFSKITITPLHVTIQTPAGTQVF